MAEKESEIKRITESELFKEIFERKIQEKQDEQENVNNETEKNSSNSPKKDT